MEIIARPAFFLILEVRTVQDQILGTTETKWTVVEGSQTTPERRLKRSFDKMNWLFGKKFRWNKPVPIEHYLWIKS